MADDASSYDFRIRISTPADLSGADAAEAAIHGLKESTSGIEGAGEKGAKGLARMVEEAGTIREAQRISQGFFDIFLGGGRTIEGTAEIMRFFIATAADINPIFATLAVVGSSIAVVAGRQAEHNEKMKEGGTESNNFATAVENAQGRVREAYEETQRQVATQADAAKAQADAAEREAAALEKAFGLRKKINDETLKGLENQALAANTDGPAGAIGIKARFADIRRGADLQSDLTDIDAQKAAKAQQSGAVQSQADIKQGEIDAARSRIEDLTNRRDDAARVAGVYGLSVRGDLPEDKKADAWKDVQKATATALKEAIDKMLEAQKSLSLAQIAGNAADEAVAQDNYYKASEVFTQSKFRAVAASNAGRTEAAYADKDTGVVATQKQVDDNSKALADLNVSIEGLQQAITNLDLQKTLTQTTAAVDKASADQATKQALQEQANKEFDAANARKLAELQRLAGDGDQSPETRESALRDAATARNAAVQRQIEQGSVAGPNRLSDETLAGLRQQMADNKAEAARQIAAMRDESLGVSAERRPQFDAATKQMTDLVAQLAARLSGSNNGEAKGEFAGLAGDPLGQARFLAQFGGSGSADESRMAQLLQQALASRNAALPAGSAPKDNQFLLADQLNDTLATATQQADAAHVALPDTINSAVGYMNRTAAIAQALMATTVPGLVALGQRLQSLETQLAAAQSQINSLKTNRGH